MPFMRKSALIQRLSNIFAQKWHSLVFYPYFSYQNKYRLSLKIIVKKA